MSDAFEHQQLGETAPERFANLINILHKPESLGQLALAIKLAKGAYSIMEAWMELPEDHPAVHAIGPRVIEIDELISRCCPIAINADTFDDPEPTFGFD